MCTMHMLGVPRGQKRALDSMVPELKIVMSHHIGMVGIELRSSVRAVTAPNLEPSLQLHLLKYFMHAGDFTFLKL